jgi:N-acetyl-gamma-glutamyl-phosphate reductase
VVEPEGDFMSAEALSGKDYMELCVTGNDERILLHARFDNLGKGASGAAIQCFNIMNGLEETAGLVV